MGEKIRLNQRKADGDREHAPVGTGKSNITATYDSPFSEILHLQRTIGNRAEEWGRCVEMYKFLVNAFDIRYRGNSCA
jgi:hypothetical protein